MSIHPLSSEDNAAILAQLDSFTDVADIELLQKKLQQDYRLLSKQFATARVKRVESYLKKIEDLQSKLKKNYNGYYSIVEQNIPEIDIDITNLNKKNSSSRLIQNQIQLQGQSNSRKDLPEIPVSPILTPISIFPDVFNSMTGKFQNDLNVLKAKYHYEAKLIEDGSKLEAEVIWRRFIQDKMDTKKKKRKLLSDDKFKLEDDYYNVSKFSKLSELEKRYRTSVRKVTEKKDRSVFNFAKQAVLKKHKFPKIIESDSMLTKASESEIDNDLEIIRNRDLSSIIITREEANYKYLDPQPKKNPGGLADGIRPTITDLVNLQLENGGNVQPIEATVVNEGMRDGRRRRSSAIQHHHHVPQPQQFQQPLQQHIPPPMQSLQGKFHQGGTRFKQYEHSQQEQQQQQQLRPIDQQHLQHQQQNHPLPPPPMAFFPPTPQSQGPMTQGPHGGNITHQLFEHLKFKEDPMQHQSHVPLPPHQPHQPLPPHQRQQHPPHQQHQISIQQQQQQQQHQMQHMMEFGQGQQR